MIQWVHRRLRAIAVVAVMLLLPAVAALAGSSNAKAAVRNFVDIGVTRDGQGYALISDAGEVYAYGSVQHRGNPNNFTGSIVGISVTADGQGYAAISSAGQVYAYGSVQHRGNGDPGTANSSAQVASQILAKNNIALARVHPSSVQDNATAYQNIVDTAAGRQASRSSYGTAPGGTVALRVTMLNALLNIGGTWSVRVSEVAGGSHLTSGSYHYKGLAFDLDRISGNAVTSASAQPVVSRCQSLGASYALFESNNHVHCQWPTSAP